MSRNRAAQETYTRNGGRFETDLTDKVWELIESLLPPSPRLGRRCSADLREVFNPIRFMLGTGCRRQEIAKCHPPFTAVQNYFCAWRNDGVFETMMDALRGHARELAGRSAEPADTANSLNIRGSQAPHLGRCRGDTDQDQGSCRR